jgi:hypothetical protein
MSELARNPFMDKCFVRESHHNNCTMISTCQNYFEIGKTIRSQVNYNVYFHSPSHEGHLRNVSAQMSKEYRTDNGAFLVHCFDALKAFFPEERYPYVVVDASYRSDNDLMRVRSNIFPNKYGKILPLCFFKNENYKN